MSGKYIQGIADDTHPGFIAKLQTDMTGLVMGIYALYCREKFSNPDLFVGVWMEMELDQRRQLMLQVWSLAEEYYTKEVIDKVLNFTFADFAF
jgi:hypothetical protein